MEADRLLKAIDGMIKEQEWHLEEYDDISCMSVIEALNNVKELIQHEDGVQIIKKSKDSPF